MYDLRLCRTRSGSETRSSAVLSGHRFGPVVVCCIFLVTYLVSPVAAWRGSFTSSTTLIFLSIPKKKVSRFIHCSTSGEVIQMRYSLSQSCMLS